MRRSRTNDKTTHKLVALTLVLSGFGAVALARDAARPEPTYERSSAKRPATRKPDRRTAIPAALHVVVEAHEPTALPAVPKSTPDAQHTRPGHAPTPEPGYWATIDRRAGLAAGWAARELVETAGRREYYRVGFYEGQREALNDRFLGDWDYRDGKRYALRAPDARQAGARIGESAAQEQARLDAEQQVTDQFLDLNRDPRFRPRPAAPSYSAPAAAVPAPTLAEVFRLFPLRGFAPLRASYDLYLADWSHGAQELHGWHAYTDFYDGGWREPQAAFSFWLRSPQRSRFYRSLSSPVARRRFEVVFDEAFQTMLADYFDRELRLVYECGFDEGWDYGAFIHTELDYRRGYHVGFQDAVARQAQTSFRRSYEQSYTRAYEQFFDDWTRNPKPAIGEVWLKDGNADGVFEPGERLRVVYELINYGGESGRFPISLSGQTLDARALDSVELPPRTVIREERPLEAQIRPRTRPRSNHELSFTLAGLTTSIPLWVSRPLEIDRRSLEVFRNNLAGELIVEIAAENVSLRPLDGSLELALVSGGRPVESISLGTLRPGDGATATFVFSELDRLALIGGELALEFTLLAEGNTQDAFTHRVADVVRDLGNRDLLLYLLELAHDPDASSREIGQAHDLMRVRLREDWKVAVIGHGNPYKSDFKRNEQATALGELVQAYLDVRDSLRQPAVFDGFSEEIVTLASTLPGTHPFLRKYLRRLAAELP